MNPDDLQKILDLDLGVKMSLQFDDDGTAYYGVWIHCGQDVYEQLQGKESAQKGVPRKLTP